MTRFKLPIYLRHIKCLIDHQERKHQSENIRWLVDDADEQYQIARDLAWTWNHNTGNSIDAISFKTVNEAIEFVERISFNATTNVLVTGSLHLLGSVLQVLHEDPIFKASANEEYLVKKKIGDDQIIPTNRTTFDQSKVESTEDSTNNQCKKRPPAFFYAPIH